MASPGWHDACIKPCKCQRNTPAETEDKQMETAKMNYLTDLAADELAVYSSSENVVDWSCGSDEVGNPVFDPANIVEQLRRDFA